MFSPVNPKPSFPELEKNLLNTWKEAKTFEKSVKQAKKDYIFYDGPPFATGLPHYGHILAGTIKDVVPRYFAMNGYKIERHWGWDCHGLPVENEVEKQLNLKSKTDIEAFGIGKFNEACRAVVLRYADEWKKTVERMGRWVDMENDYKTMSPEFMESIWWVFKSLWQKGLIYEGHKVVPYCPRCATPLSNFETNQGYKEKQDPALTVKFELVNEPGTYLLAWTTTPWTLPSNLAVAVGPKITYATVRDKKTGEKLILALDRLPHYYKNPADYELIGEVLGSRLEGLKYKPLLPYYASKTEPRVFTVTTGNFVTLEDGTGLVHMAPFGEDDMNTLKSLGIAAVYPLDAECRFNHEVAEYQGKEAFEANPLIIKKLKDEGKVVRHETINHSYPHCWRCDTPLIYRPIATWFVNVESLKKGLLAANNKINWIPEHLKQGRFGKWLEGARDWAISRNRYWGTPLPIWRNPEDPQDLLVLGSISELNESSGQKVTDIHKHIVDDIKLNFKTDIVFVRHGETDWNKTHRIQGTTDNPLNETGVKQAHEAAEKLKGEKFDLIVSSPLKRARQTADILAKGLKLKVTEEENLKERSFGEWEGKHVKEDLGFSPDEPAAFRLSTPPGGESLPQVALRLYPVLRKYSGKRILVVAHRNVFFAIEKICQKVSFEEAVKHPARNATPHPLTFTASYQRVPEVLDCWFESGSMPYAQLHYPFENKAKFEKNFPAKFIAEGLDQTRGWFYTLHVLANALFKKPAFQNVIVNGIVLAEDGQKMSKRLKNYPDPNRILETYGADALRFYLMNSPVVKADDLRFSEKGVADVIRSVLLPLWNAYSFLVTYANVDHWKPSKKPKKSTNKLDRWILQELNKLIVQERSFMEAYDLQKASNALYEFIDNLTNWYIRRSRRRFWKSEDDADKAMAYETLHQTLVTLCQVLAPFMPFVSEEIYRNLTGEESVHLSAYPKAAKAKTDVVLESEMRLAKAVVSLGLAARAAKKIKVRQPLQKAQVALGETDPKILQGQTETIMEELNVKEVEFLKDVSSIASVIARPNSKLLGPKYGPQMQEILREAKAGKFEKLSNGNVRILNIELLPSEIEIAYEPKEGFDVQAGQGVLVALDTTVTPELAMEGEARDVIRQLQELRKAAGYTVSDRIRIALINASPELLERFGELIKKETLATAIESDLELPDQAAPLDHMVLKVKR